MPLYEYECASCDHRFETLQRFSDPPLSECPRCNGLLQRVVSPPAIQFKGTGWYVTDYAGKTAAAQEKRNGETGSSAPSETETKAAGEKQEAREKLPKTPSGVTD